MKKKVLLTAVGCPGAGSIIRLLRNYYDLYGVDCDPEAYGLEMIPGEVIFPASFDRYLNDIIRIIREKNIDFVLPMSSQELMKLSILKAVRVYNGIEDCKILVNDKEKLKICLNKGRTCGMFYEEDFLYHYSIVNNKDDMYRFMEKDIECWEKDEMKNGLFIKPCESNGSRGLMKCILKDKYCVIDLESKPVPYQIVHKDNLLKVINWEQVKKVNGLLITPFFKGKEWSADIVRDFYGNSIIVTRVRERVRSGICVKGRIEKNEELEKISKYIVDKLDLYYNVNLQFIETERGFKLIEINPRVSGTIVLSSQVVNLPRLALEVAEGKNIWRTVERYDY